MTKGVRSGSCVCLNGITGKGETSDKELGQDNVYYTVEVINAMGKRGEGLLRLSVSGYEASGRSEMMVALVFIDSY